MTAGLPEGTTAAQLKACCADVYGSDWARLLLGDSFHPGGTRLTDRLADLLQLGPDTRVLDVAAGRGVSAIHLARSRGCRVVGVDLSAANVEAATAQARAAAVDDRVTFITGDAESLARDGDGGFDAVICECAFCTFPDKAKAARGFVEALRPGGRVGISDLTRDGELPSELQGLFAWVACIADALPVEEYTTHLRDAGLRIDAIEPHDGALVDFVEAIRQKLTTASLLAQLGRISLRPTDLEGAHVLARAALDAVRGGRLGYAIVCASAPAPDLAS